MLPKSKNASSLLKIEQSNIGYDRLCLNEKTAVKINRVLEEHKAAQTLARFGYGFKESCCSGVLLDRGKTLTAFIWHTS